MITMFLAVARIEVALKWEVSKDPTIEAWHKRLWDLSVLNKISDHIIKNGTNYSSKCVLT